MWISVSFPIIDLDRFLCDEWLNDLHMHKEQMPSKKCSILWLTYQQGKIFETFKSNNKFINMINQFGISKSMMIFEIYIVKFLNNSPKMKKPSLSLHHLNNNFKIIKNIC